MIRSLARAALSLAKTFFAVLFVLVMVAAIPLVFTAGVFWILVCLGVYVVALGILYGVFRR